MRNIILSILVFFPIVCFSGGSGIIGDDSTDYNIPGYEGGSFLWDWGQIIAGENWKIIDEVEKIEGVNLFEQLELQEARYVGREASLALMSGLLGSVLGIKATKVDQDEVEVKVKTLDDEFKIRSFKQDLSREQLELIYKSYENGTTLILGQ